MTAAVPSSSPPVVSALDLAAFGALVPISRAGGQGRVYLPARIPPPLGSTPVVLAKLYRARPGERAAQALGDMVAFRAGLERAPRASLDEIAAWPLASVHVGGELVGIAMADLRPRYAVAFTMPSGRREQVLLGLEHLLGADGYLHQRGIDVTLDTRLRVFVAERIAAALASLHRHAIVASDIAPSNVLVSFASSAPGVCLIDCDSMVFRGRQALAAVETADWQMPAAFDEPPLTRAADAYKLGLVVLRLLARSHAQRALEPASACVPSELRPLLARALSADARNRPPAGEWAHALRAALSDPFLARRHPGPRVPTLAAVAAVPAPEPPARGARAPARRPPPRRRAGHRPAGEAVRALIFIAAILLWGFILLRVFNAAVGSGASDQTPRYFLVQPGGAAQGGQGGVGFGP